MGHFNNFKVTVYCVAQILEKTDLETLKTQYEFIEKYVGLDKVYLEPYRDGHWVDKEKMSSFIDFFKGQNVEVAVGEKEIELNEVKLHYDFKTINEKIADVILNPGEFYEFKVGSSSN